jgi:hypothetical protein
LQVGLELLDAVVYGIVASFFFKALANLGIDLSFATQHFNFFFFTTQTSS